MAGSCGLYLKPPYIDTDWVACLNRETAEDGSHICPHGLLKVDDGDWCKKDRRNSVCCMLHPKLNFNVMINFCYILFWIVKSGF